MHGIRFVLSYSHHRHYQSFHLKPAPQNSYNSSTNGLTSSGITNITNIITDFEIPISATNQYRSEISYVPQGEYRLRDMYSNFDIYKIDLNAFYKDKWGNMNPLLLEPGCSTSVKILFRSKKFYLGIKFLKLNYLNKIFNIILSIKNI